MPDKNPPAFPPGIFLCGKPHVAGTLWIEQAADRLPLLILHSRIALGSSSSGFLCGKPHAGRHTCKNEHPGQGRRLLSSCLRFPHRPPVPQTGRIFAGSVRQTARSGWRWSLPPRWSITGQLSLWQRRGHSAGSALVRRDFCIEKGQTRKPVLFESMGKRSINSWLRGSGRMPWDVHIRGKPREPSRPRGCSRSWSTAIQPSRSWQILRPSLR